MRRFITLQDHRYRVTSIERVSERIQNDGTDPTRYGFYLSTSHRTDWVGYPKEDLAVAVLDDLHKLLDEESG